MKKWIATVWLTLLLAIIFSFFWYNQLVYSLPTPIPANYRPAPVGKKILLGSQYHFSSSKPVFLHFFNPDCPCSRFNIEEFRSLVKTYHKDVDFAVILMTSKAYTPEQVQRRFGITVPVLTDTAIATQCGVYSTPQAVVLDTSRELYYRGNYNKSRYCTDTRTNYANIALMGVLNKKTQYKLDKFAVKAYGCILPDCKN